MSVGKRISLNFSANIYAQFVSVAYQLLTVPLFLAFWSKELYGEWLVLSALPAYIALSNMGLMNVAQNNMTMAMAAGDVQKARQSLHTVWGAQLLINILVGLLIVALLSFFDIADALKLEHITRGAATLAVGVMCFYAMANLQAGVFGGIYRAVGLNARGVFIGNTVRLISVMALAIGLWSGIKNVVVVALILAGTYLAGAVFLFWDAGRLAPELRPGLSAFHWADLKQDLKHGVAFMAYPLGRAFTNQGMLLFTNHFLSSSAVVTLATLRTVVNIAFQLSNLISLSTWPEFSRLFGEGKREKFQKLFCYSTGLGAWAGVGTVLILLLIGPMLLFWWTRGEVVVSRSLLGLFLVPVLLNSFWYTALAAFNATNRHHRISLLFLISSILVPVVAFGFHQLFGLGLVSVGIGFLSMDLVMLLYVLPKSLSFVEISIGEWFLGMLRTPEQVFQRLPYTFKLSS